MDKSDKIKSIQTDLRILRGGMPGLLDGKLIDLTSIPQEMHDPDTEPMSKEGIKKAIAVLLDKEKELVDGIIIEVRKSAFFVDKDDRKRVFYEIHHDTKGTDYDVFKTSIYVSGCPIPQKHQILYRKNDIEGFLWTDERSKMPNYITVPYGAFPYNEDKISAWWKEIGMLEMIEWAEKNYPGYVYRDMITTGHDNKFEPFMIMKLKD